jgi:hypothetical protein
VIGADDEHYLRKVFSMRGSTSRNQLERVPPEGGVRQTV